VRISKHLFVHFFLSLSLYFSVAFCIYYGHEMMKWLDGNEVCQKMANSVGEPTRLLELNNLNEFDFIRKSIQKILKDDQMKPEINTRNRILSSATAFIGSQGKRISKEGKLNMN